jgi:hypothetical protein
MALVLSGFYYIGGDRWQRWAVCLVGFIVARMVVTRVTRAPPPAPASEAKGAQHAN